MLHFHTVRRILLSRTNLYSFYVPLSVMNENIYLNQNLNSIRYLTIALINGVGQTVPSHCVLTAPRSIVFLLCRPSCTLEVIVLFIRQYFSSASMNIVRNLFSCWLYLLALHLNGFAFCFSWALKEVTFAGGSGPKPLRHTEPSCLTIFRSFIDQTSGKPFYPASSSQMIARKLKLPYCPLPQFIKSFSRCLSVHIVRGCPWRYTHDGRRRDAIYNEAV